MNSEKKKGVMSYWTESKIKIGGERKKGGDLAQQQVVANSS